jgi:tryptophanyl-tRNA synthetase
VFEYLDAFHENKAEVDELKAHYKRGGLGDTTIKSILNNSLQSLLEPIREKRHKLQRNDLLDKLIHGTKLAREVAKAKIEEIRSVIGIKY